jgi:hypothetical protein
MTVKRCVICKQSLPLTAFNKRVASDDGLQIHCRECNRQRARAYYERNREKHKQDVRPYIAQYQQRNRALVFEHLRSHPCVDCGEQDVVVLEFDHVREQKTDAVTQLVWRTVSVETLLAEIAKCDVRCVNCHRRKTHRERGTWKGKMRPSPPKAGSG